MTEVLLIFLNMSFQLITPKKLSKKEKSPFNQLYDNSKKVRVETKFPKLNLCRKEGDISQL